MSTRRAASSARRALLHDLPSLQSRSLASSTKKSTTAALLSKPTWSVRSLLPAKLATEADDEVPVTSEHLHHLLRLSALPRPETTEDEATMLRVLRSQLHFVRDIQSIDTTNVEPLRSIRDSTSEGLDEAKLGWAQLRGVLEKEVTFGYRRRPKRLQQECDPVGEEPWDLFAAAETKIGRYFAVRARVQPLK